MIEAGKRSAERITKGDQQMASAATILEWLKEAGAYAFRREDPDEAPQLGLSIDLLIGGSTVGVRVTRGARQGFKSLTWTQIERAKSNPLMKLIDEVIEVSRK